VLKLARHKNSSQTLKQSPVWASAFAAQYRRHKLRALPEPCAISIDWLFMTDESEQQPGSSAVERGEANLTTLFIDDRYSEILALVLQALPDRSELRKCCSRETFDACVFRHILRVRLVWWIARQPLPPLFTAMCTVPCCCAENVLQPRHVQRSFLQVALAANS
jgi:hypothetical protein